MNFLTKLSTLALWSAALFCLCIGLFVASEHTMHFFANHNYFFSPFADDILDNANSSYPIALGKQGFMHVFDPYIDHRIATERVQEIIDFTFTQGVQSLQPYRLSLFLWLNFLFFSYFVIIKNNTLRAPSKVLLSGAYLIFIFAGMSINNYVSTMQHTWPLIFLFSLFTFISLAKYCESLKKNAAAIKLYSFMFLTILNINIVLYSFNIGAILWPIVFIILIKQRCLRRQWLLWIGAAILTYYCYISLTWILANWFSYTQHTTIETLLLRPLHIFLYLSRIISLPFLPSAFNQFSAASISIGGFLTLISLTLMYYFLSMRTWSAAETIFFGYLLFAMGALVIISTIRPVSGKYTAVEWRFLTSGLQWLFCAFMALFLLPIESKQYRRFAHGALTIFIPIWLIFIFIPMDAKFSGGTYQLGFFNQVFISEAINIPIDNNFLQASQIYQSSGVLRPHVEINTIQKDHKKGPFSFWSAQYINHSLNELHYNKISAAQLANIKVIYDYRPYHNPGILLNVKLAPNTTVLTNKNEVLFTNSHDQIIGFAISAPYLQSLWSVIKRENKPILLWRGAINYSLVDTDHVVNAWAVAATTLYKLGSITLTQPNMSQAIPSWFWQKTVNFGI